MKTLISILLLAVSITSYSQKENKKYVEAMKKNISIIDTAADITSLQSVANSFERIGNAEKDKWLPDYYAAYALTRVSYLTEDKTKVDEILDKADGLISKADTLEPNNSEIYTVKSFIAAARIMVNPMMRGAQYGAQSGMLIEKAIALDPFNPRPWFLKGTSAFYTPPAFGGGKDKAKPLFETAMEKFKSFVPKDDLMPHWGQTRCEDLLKQCE